MRAPTHTDTHTQSTMRFLPLQLTPSHTALKVLLAGHLLWVAFLEPPKKLTFLLPSQPTSLSRLAHDPATIYGLRLRCVWSLSIPLSVLLTALSTAPCEQQCSLNKSCIPALFISVWNTWEDSGYQEGEGGKTPFLISITVLPSVTLHVNSNFTSSLLFLETQHWSGKNSNITRTLYHMLRFRFRNY